MGWLPECVLSEGTTCWDCPIGDDARCPIRTDDEYRSYLRWLRETYLEKGRVRARRIAVLRTILVQHGLPLHWEVIAGIALKVAPTLFASSRSVMRFLYGNPSVFETKQDGIFRLGE